MALDTSVGRHFSVLQIVRMAYGLAGLKETSQALSDAEFAEASGYLELILDNLSNNGFIAREATWTDVSVLADTSVYNLPDDVLSVEGDGYLGSDRGLVIRTGSQVWQETIDEEETGRPRYLYVHKSGTGMQVWLAPIPTAPETLKLLCRRVLADCRSGQATLDMERGASRYLVKALEADLRNAHLGPANASAARAEAENMLNKMLGRQRENIESEFEFCIEPLNY